MAARILYVDASRLDDSGNGLTPATAKRTPRAAQSISLNGDRILIKAGYCYAPLSGHFMRFTGVSNIEVGTYGTASDKPILDALSYDNPGSSGWTHVSNGIWKKTFGPFFIRRLWVNSVNNGIRVADRTLGIAKRRATGTGLKVINPNPSEEQILAALNASDIWATGGSTLGYALYVYTGSTTINPSTFYGGLAFIQSDGVSVGAIEGIVVQNQTGIYVHDLHFRGNGGVGIRLYAQNSDVRDVENCLFEDCIVTAPYQGAFLSRINGELNPVRRIKSSTTRRVFCDYLSSPDEQEPNENYAYLTAMSDLFSIADGSVAISIENCTAINSAHFGFVSGSVSMNTAPPIGSRVVNNTVRYDTWNTYGRGLGSFNGSVLFSGNLIDGQNTRSQLAGTCTVVGNIWTNLRPSVRKPSVSQGIAIESYIFDSNIGNIGNERYVYIEPVNVLIANNTFDHPCDAAIGMHFYKQSTGPADNVFPAQSVTIRNNIVNRLVSRFLQTYEDSGRIIPAQILEKNCVYNGQSGDNKIRWRGADYAINVAPGCTSNLEENPDMDSTYQPRNPALRGTGVTVIGKDFNGKQFYDPPNIGAIDIETNYPRYQLVDE